jgi:1-deoxy-D-xylulose-5-phosphate reductoisomerase
MKKIVILGATGSIGTQTVDIVRRLPDRFKIVGISGRSNRDRLYNLATEFSLPPERVACGDDDLAAFTTAAGADIVVVAVSGATGIKATAAQLALGGDVALATKEVLVAAGEPITRTARESGARILPIDSEHSAIFQCLQGAAAATMSPSQAADGLRQVRRIWLTASGGPFRAWDKSRIEQASLSDALAHPTWPSMGRKITVDSATMMNKGLEMIEARWLFDMPVEKIGVVVHAQSVVHSLVEFTDGSVLAQMGHADMRQPILYALTYPERVDAGLPPFDITRLAGPLTFTPPDEDRFPCLRLAREAASIGGTLPAVMNAANETAVALFLEEKIRFADIPGIVERCMGEHHATSGPPLEEIFAADAWARAAARLVCAKAETKGVSRDFVV